MYEEEMKKWVKDNYPSMLGNLELARKLYNFRVLGKEPEVVQLLPYRKIDRLEINVPSLVKGIVVKAVKIKEKKYCNTCQSSKCFIEDHEKNDLFVAETEIMDETGMLDLTYFSKSKESIEGFSTVTLALFNGKKIENTFGVRFTASGYIKLEEGDDLRLTKLETHLMMSGAALIGEDAGKFKEFVEKEGSRMLELAKMIGVSFEGGNVVWKTVN